MKNILYGFLGLTIFFSAMGCWFLPYVKTYNTLEACEAQCGKGNCRSFVIRESPYTDPSVTGRDPFLDDSERVSDVLFECKEKGGNS